MKARALDVLHVAQPTDAGVARYVAAACADQLARGWDVAVACPDGGRLADDLAALGVPRLRWSAGRAPGPAVAAETIRLRRLVARAAPRVVHLHSAKAGLAGRLAVGGRLPTLFQPHGWSWLAVRGTVAAATLRWERTAARWTSTFVCCGEGEAADGHAHGVGGSYAVVRNGVDLDRFTPAEPAERAAARVRLGLPAGVPVVACLGRVTRQKGQDVLLRAWPEVRAQHPDAILCLVGDGDMLAGLQREPVPGVRWCAPVSDVRPWYAAADLVVLPSRWEGLSLTLLEALASGRAVVASAVAGLAEAVPAEVGALVPVEDPGALAAAVARRLADPALLRAESTAAARYAVDRFDTRRTFEHLATLTAEAGAAGRAGWHRPAPVPNRG